MFDDQKVGKIILPPYIHEIHGKIGDFQYQMQKYGCIKQRKTIPKNPPSEKQKLIRNFVGLVSSEWKWLPESEREKWRKLAKGKKGKHKKGGRSLYTGYTWYLHCKFEEWFEKQKRRFGNG